MRVPTFWTNTDSQINQVKVPPLIIVNYFYIFLRKNRMSKASNFTNSSAVTPTVKPNTTGHWHSTHSGLNDDPKSEDLLLISSRTHFVIIVVFETPHLLSPNWNPNQQSLLTGIACNDGEGREGRIRRDHSSCLHSANPSIDTHWFTNLPGSKWRRTRYSKLSSIKNILPATVISQKEQYPSQLPSIHRIPYRTPSPLIDNLLLAAFLDDRRPSDDRSLSNVRVRTCNEFFWDDGRLWSPNELFLSYDPHVKRYYSYSNLSMIFDLSFPSLSS